MCDIIDNIECENVSKLSFRDYSDLVAKSYFVNRECAKKTVYYD